MMKNYDESVEINHNPNFPYILNHPNRMAQDQTKLMYY